MIGDYATLKGFASIRLFKNDLWVKMLGHKLKMIPNEDGLFSLQYYLFGFIPLNLKFLSDFRIAVRIFNGEKVFILEQKGFQKAVGEEYVKKAIPKVWLNRVGEYKVLNPDKDFQLLVGNPVIEYRDGILLFNATGRGFGIGKLSFVLNPISNYQAVTVGLGRSAHETIFVKKENGFEILEYSGYKFKKIR